MPLYLHFNSPHYRLPYNNSPGVCAGSVDQSAPTRILVRKHQKSFTTLSLSPQISNPPPFLTFFLCAALSRVPLSHLNTTTPTLSGNSYSNRFHFVAFLRFIASFLLIYAPIVCCWLLCFFWVNLRGIRICFT